MTSDTFFCALEWIIGDFFPFGDLVSDFWLLFTLDVEPGEDVSSPITYKRMWWMLACGTIVDAIPEMALLLAITAGAVLVLLLGPILCITGWFKEELREITSAVWQCMRRTTTDGKSITHYVFHEIEDRERSLRRIVEHITWIVLVVPHLPFLWFMCVPGSPYYKVVAVQAVAGAVTEIASIYFSVITNETPAIVSAGFGMFSLLVSTIVAIFRGFQAATDGRNEGPAREKDLADCLPLSCGGDYDEPWFSWFSFRERPRVSALATVALIAIPVVGLVGVYLFDTGQHILAGQILMSIGFGVWLWILFLYAASEDGANFDRAWQAMALSAAFVGLVLGVYYWVKGGVASRVVIALLSSSLSIVLFVLSCLALVWYSSAIEGNGY